MEINGVNPQQIQKIYQQQRQLLSESEANQERESGDRMEISAEARQIHEFAVQMEETPDIRQERVAELRQEVQSGSYEIDPEQIAESMIDEMEAANPASGEES
ncbi:flagellar biosynthesis anti-sigma factor FlgM [Halarsenatibacter silvermanii]|uniref:Negative regulator of flagellin synthesis n=1 Tax=Halarsenatibacter silvermanii TaxID=321763 RepID=A0A1G9LZU8_9FIRM|nr:flagellar biosynthesis anti-sigma factor FlgM [Halarsenatibacter silvermanii]SDL67540.1 anti-sigma-28 factor, FlgM family [Halarsenatibacter silvermanii]